VGGSADGRQVSEMRIALVGTRGVPARYGGFETCVEEVGSRLADRGHEVLVYCRYAYGGVAQRPGRYRGMTLVHRGALRRRSLETLSHTALSVAHLARQRADVAVVFNSANSPFLPVLRAAGIPVATHLDGLEWLRGKWGPVGRRYYQVAERLAVRWSDAVIADAAGIQAYHRRKFGVEADLIVYGAPRIAGRPNGRIGELGLVPGGFHLVVARFEPENHVHMIVDGYRRSAARLPLVVVGSAPYADEYTRTVHALADARVLFLGAVWDQELLDQLYVNARSYLHGHSVGGTNPSLLRALGAGTATTAFDVVFNREVLEEAGRYFCTPEDVARLVEDTESDIAGTQARATRSGERAALYDWEMVTDRYESLCHRLVTRHAADPRVVTAATRRSALGAVRSFGTET
jgi:glycosyltransferase involved in cell wall biosynthesis